MRTLISICSKDSVSPKNSFELLELGENFKNLHISYDGGNKDIVGSGWADTWALSGNDRGIKAGTAANRNRSLKYFSKKTEFDTILILDDSIEVKRQGLIEKLEAAIEETKQPFLSIGSGKPPLMAGSEWVLYFTDVSNTGIFLTREAFDKVGYFNNTPKFQTLYLQRLMRAFGYSPQYLPAFRYPEYFLDITPYQEVQDPRYEKLYERIWKGYDLKELNPGLPKKGEFLSG